MTWESTGSMPVLREGAALIFDDDDGALVFPVFFLLTDVGTKAVASLFKSRNCGSAESVAADIVASDGCWLGKTFGIPKD